jgi:hypothetical protein
MAAENRMSVHTDFRLLHHSGNADGDGEGGLGQLLREAWPVPLDTYVTEDMPLLLTLLSLPERRTVGSVMPRDGGRAIPRPVPAVGADHERSFATDSGPRRRIR